MSQDSKPLQWTDELATGIEVIDMQHKRLISILNEANLCFRDNGDAERRKQVIDDLVSYTVYHFDTEEMLMKNSRAGAVPAEHEQCHIQEHRAFAAKATEYQAAVHADASIDCDTVFSFLNHWIVQHVMGTDKKLGEHLQTAP